MLGLSIMLFVLIVGAFLLCAFYFVKETRYLLYNVNPFKCNKCEHVLSYEDVEERKNVDVKCPICSNVDFMP